MGIPQKLATVGLGVEKDTLLGHLTFGGSTRIATATQGFKHTPLKVGGEELAGGTRFNLKIIPGVDGKPEVLEIVKYAMTNVKVHFAFTGPSALSLSPHALAPIAALPVVKILESVHYAADMTLPFGEVVFDYLKKQ